MADELVADRTTANALAALPRLQALWVPRA